MIEKEFDNIDRHLLSVHGKIIHQCFHFFKPDPPDYKYPELPEKFVKLRETWIQNNPEWTHILWTPIMADWLVYKYYPEYWDVYSKYDYPVQRADFVRLCMMHRYAGVYADIDTRCQQPVETVISDLDARDMRILGVAKGATITKTIKTPSNYMMYAKHAGHAFWIAAMDGAKKYGNGTPLLPYHINIFNSSGPARVFWTMRKIPGAVGFFNPKLVGTHVPSKSRMISDLASEYSVVHEMHGNWLPTSQIILLILYILLIVLVIVNASIFAIKLARFQYNKNLT